MFVDNNENKNIYKKKDPLQIKNNTKFTQSMGINDKQDYFGNESEIMIDNENDSLNQSSIGKKYSFNKRRRKFLGRFRKKCQRIQ